MSLQTSLDTLHRSIKAFQDAAKSRIFNLGKFKITIINPNNKKEKSTLNLGLYYLRNTIKEFLNAKIKLKEFNILHKTIKRFFQKFIDTPELINFDKGADLFSTLNENSTISPFKILFSVFFKDKIKIDSFNSKCTELKKNLSNFDIFKDKYREYHAKFLYFKSLKQKFEQYQDILNSGNIKKMNEEPLVDFRLFRSFYPLNLYSEYIIDIKNKCIIKLEASK